MACYGQDFIQNFGNLKFGTDVENVIDQKKFSHVHIYIYMLVRLLPHRSINLSEEDLGSSPPPLPSPKIHLQNFFFPVIRITQKQQ